MSDTIAQTAAELTARAAVLDTRRIEMLELMRTYRANAAREDATTRRMRGQLLNIMDELHTIALFDDEYGIRGNSASTTRLTTDGVGNWFEFSTVDGSLIRQFTGEVQQSRYDELAEDPSEGEIVTSEERRGRRIREATIKQLNTLYSYRTEYPAGDRRAVMVMDELHRRAISEDAVIELGQANRRKYDVTVSVLVDLAQGYMHRDSLTWNVALDNASESLKVIGVTADLFKPLADAAEILAAEYRAARPRFTHSMIAQS